MAELRISAQARRDLEVIGETGSIDYGASVAAAHLTGFLRLFRLLRDQPFAGQARPELAPDVRSISHRPHRIMYRVIGDVVVIERVLHQAQDIARALRDEP